MNATTYTGTSATQTVTNGAAGQSFQPDFILEYAHYLGDHFTKQGYKNVQVHAKSYVALNGRLSQLFIDESVNLYQEKESFKHKHWILPFTDEIKGL